MGRDLYGIVSDEEWSFRDQPQHPTYAPVSTLSRLRLPVEDRVSTAESKVVSHLERNIGELFDEGYRRSNTVKCMDRFLKELQADGVEFRGEKVALAENGDLVGKEDPGTTFNTYDVFDDYSRKEMAYGSIAPRAANLAAKAATGIAETVKDAYQSADRYVIEPIDENFLNPIFDALGETIKYAVETAEACIDEFMVGIGVGQRATINRPQLAMATCACQAEVEAYWNGRTFQAREEEDKSDTITEKIAGFFSRIWG